jgi:hypothetical protein
MSDLYINIRIFDYHFQLNNRWKFRISNNADSHSRKGYPNGKFRIYQFFN